MMSVLNIHILVPWLLAMVLGIFVGGIPGLTATMAVALIVPLTYHMQPIAGLAMIIGVSFTSIFSGDIPATFLRVPGTPASGTAVLDGYQLFKKGHGATAISLDLFCSAIGGVIGILLLIFISPLLASFALKFTHFEYFWLGVLGLSMSTIISKGSNVKGFFSMGVGVLVSTIGIDLVTGYPRFTFGNSELMGGISFIPVMIGLFGISEVIKNIADTSPKDLLVEDVSVIKGKMDISLKSVAPHLKGNVGLILRSSVMGTLIGALPGAGSDVAAWVSYGAAKKTSKHPDEFGQGSIEGVIAPTSANNAAIGGSWIPALVFGIPGDTITSIVLGAMLMYGLKPGPLIFQGERALVDQIFAVGLLSQVFLLFIGFLGIKAYAYIFKCPRSIINSSIIIFSIVGSFALRNSVFDIGLVAIFGFIGFACERGDVPLPPMILGLILGPMVEENLRIGLVKTDGNFLQFLQRPISFVLFVIVLLLFLWSPVKNLVSRKK
jgi:TctA family transporter